MSNNLTQEEKINQIHTVILGVPGTDDRGLVGLVKTHDKRINNISRRTWIIIGVLITISSLVGKSGIGLW